MTPDPAATSRHDPAAFPMQGKRAMVTGGTNGIGLAAATMLAEQGADVVVVGRDPEKGQRTVAALPRRAGADQQHAFYAVDLAHRAMVRDFLAQANRDLPRLDLLLNNAGGWFSKRTTSPDGVEMTWALNHLSYFRLANGLAGLLRRTAERHGEARVVNQSSGAHHEGAFNWDDPEFAHGWDTLGKGSVGAGWGVYAQSKLANVAFTLALDRRLAGTGVAVNAVHPGVVVTGFSQNNGWLYRLAAPLRKLGNRATPRDGARPAVVLGAAPEMAGVTGQYYGPPQRHETPSALALDVASQERLWALSERYESD